MEKHNGKKLKWKLFASMAAVFLFAGCSMEASVPDEVERVTPVNVAKVTLGDLNIMNEVVGTVEPAKSIAVIPEVTGKLQELRVKRGDFVEAGQVLAIVDSSDLSLNLQLSQAGLAASRAQLDAALSRERQAEDAAKTALREGQDSVQTRENLEQARIAAEQARASVKQAELQVTQAQNRLQHATITAPISGEVASVGAEAGELVSTQGPLVTIVSSEDPKIVAQVTAEQLALFEEGKQVAISVPSLNLNLEGTVLQLPKASEQNGLFTIEVGVPDQEGKLKFGMAAVIQIEEQAVANAIIIPTQSIVERGEEVYVFIVEEETAVLKPVEVIQMLSDHTAVNGELSEGDSIVIKGQLTLSDGNKVELMGEGL